MVVCKYWRNGTCRNGSNCRFDHPNGQNSSNQTGGNQSNNNRQGGFGARGGAFGSLSRPERWALNEDDIRSDLTSTRPKWILSAYGPGKDPPASLFVENEYSPEEVRWRFYEQQAKGNADAADQEAIKVWNDADSAMRTAAANVKDVQQFMEQKEKEHPNRYDFTNVRFDGKTTREEFVKNSQLNQQPGSSINPFGGTSNRITPSTNPFSRPAFGQSSSPFSQPAQTTSFGQTPQTSSFGQPSQPSAFGKPAQTASFGQTAFGQPSQPSAFGQPSQTSASGQSTQPSGFGQPAQPSGFGQPAQPSAFGKPAFGQGGFGQGGFGQTSSPFGQAKSAFGQPASGGGSSPFGGKPAGGAAGSGFGQPSNPAQSNNPFAKPTAAAGFGSNTAGAGFGQTGFGQTAAPAGNASPFGQQAGSNTTQSSFGQSKAPENTASPFGGTVESGANASAFGADSTPQTSFGPSPFGKPAPQGSGFGQPQQPSAFGQPVQSAQPQQQQPAFGQPTQPQPGLGPSPFGKPAQAPGFGQSPFSQPSQPQSQSGFGQQKSSFSGFGPSPFGTTAAEQKTQNTQSSGQGSVQTEQTAAQPSSSKPTNQPVQPLHYTQTLPGVPPQLQQGEQLTAYRNMPVTYITKLRPTADGTEVVDSRTPVYARPDGKGQERIWFPQAAQNPDVVKLAKALADFQASEEKYTDEVKGVYGRLYETGRFDQGKIPLVPPMRGWVDYDF